MFTRTLLVALTALSFGCATTSPEKVKNPTSVVVPQTVVTPKPHGLQVLPPNVSPPQAKGFPPGRMGASAIFTNPNLTYGHVQLAAATAALIPAVPMSSRTNIGIKNMDSAYIWCGSDSSVTNVTGWPIDPGGSTSFPVSYNGTSVNLWCYSVLGQTSPNDTHWAEVR